VLFVLVKGLLVATVMIVLPVLLLDCSISFVVVVLFSVTLNEATLVKGLLVVIATIVLPIDDIVRDTVVNRPS
jgi:hypothetical protein